MKKILPLMLLSLLCYSCQVKTIAPMNIHVSAIVDVTDQHRALPNAGLIIKLFGFNVDKNIEASFKLCSLTDKQLNPDKNIYLSDASVTEKDNLEDDPYNREKLVLSFNNEVRKTITDFIATNRSDTSLRYSECFQIIANELKGISENPGGKNIVLIFSDLQENSDLFNCYSTANVKLLHKEPNKVVDIFKASHLLPDKLQNTQIIFVYQPRTREDDLKFNAMVNIYRKLLESRGATIKVQANNDKY